MAFKSRVAAAAFTVAKIAPLRTFAIEAPLITESAKELEKRHPLVSKIAEFSTYYTVGFASAEYARSFIQYLESYKVPYAKEIAITAIASLPVVPNLLVTAIKTALDVKKLDVNLFEIPGLFMQKLGDILRKADFAALTLVYSVLEIPITWGFVSLIKGVAGDSMERISSLRAGAAIGLATVFAGAVSYGGFIFAWAKFAQRNLPKGHPKDFVKGFAETISLTRIWREIGELAGICKGDKKMPKPETVMQEIGQLVGISESHYAYVQALRIGSAFVIGYLANVMRGNFVIEFFCICARNWISAAMDIIGALNSVQIRAYLENQQGQSLQPSSQPLVRSPPRELIDGSPQINPSPSSLH